MSKIHYSRRPVAAFLLLLFSINTFFPLAGYGLTSGPQQPETATFQGVGVNDLVDPFTGDFRYNIPLMDVGGYPLNLSYSSGQSLDDEASWVGFGWSLNPGSVNRQLRGIPDDFSGKEADGDVIEKQVAMKPFIAKGVAAKVQLKRKGRKFPGVIKHAFDVAITYNNYTGINADVGFNSTIGQMDHQGTSSTLNLGVNSNSQQGGNFFGGVNFASASKLGTNREYQLGSSIGFDYNATRGLEGLTLGGTFGIKPGSQKSLIDFSGNEFISFAGESYIPAVEIPQRTKTFNYGLRLGPVAFGLALGGGVTGSYSKQDIAPANRKRLYPAYGMINAHEGKNNDAALTDFNRENDRPYHPKLPNLPVPVINHDLFHVTSQNASGQYKISTSGSGIFSDNTQRSLSEKFGLGIEAEFGNTFAIATPELSYNRVSNRSGKWHKNNEFKTNGDFIKTSASNPLNPETYFKKVGEGTVNESVFRNRIGNKEAVAVRLRNDLWAKTLGNGTANNKLRSTSGKEFTTILRKETQEKQNEAFRYLKASEASRYGLEKYIPSYPANTIILKGCNDGTVVNLPRESAASGKKPHHISEVSVTDEQGVRQVYGIPVYNLRQDEVSFSIKADDNARKTGLARFPALDDSVPLNDDDPRFRSKDYLYNFNKQRLGGYASSFLLTAILSPDYVDVTGNGITDDDLGEAVKFNYTKLGDYKWRTPFFKVGSNTELVGNYNEGWLSDKKDDKVSYVYGEREQWYLHSVESKTMLAIFIMEDRCDGLGVTNSNGALNTSFKLKKLKEIRLYSKADLYKNKNNLSLATPVKTVHFTYDYALFNDVPNSLEQGKLTLKEVSFTFNKNGRGRLHPYTFKYNVPAFQKYQFRQYDRWGMYKPADSSNRNGLNNAEFPYSTQDRVKADRWAGYWQLSQIGLPSGGVIDVTYESDDYAYVQDKRASTMCFLKGIDSLNKNTGIIKSNTLFIELPVPVTDVQELKEKYFEDVKQLYFKAFVDLDNKNKNYEFVPGYANIEKIELENFNTAKVTVSRIDGYNPVSKAAWQILRNSLPKLAYDNYDNLDSDESGFVKAVTSMISAIGRIPDVVRSFDTRASNKNFASRVNLNKSWVRLRTPDMKKLGGGSRVKKIMMLDKWSEMTGNANTISASYGQAYYYTTQRTMPGGSVAEISSGVASYEPQIGGDENPFKLPVKVTEKKFLGLDQHYYLEQPFGETYFPAPVVGYSKVMIKNIGADGSVGNTGSTTLEYYTAKDFPTRVEQTDLQKVHPALKKGFRLFAVKLTEHATVSQGYVIENYNMHGKQKAERIVDRNNREVTAVYYKYKTQTNDRGKPALDNLVPVMGKDGNVTQAIMGVDYDFYTDMNEHSSESMGVTGEPGVGFHFSPWPRPWFYFGGFSPNFDRRIYRSSVSIKAINTFPVLEKITKVEKGSKIETENLLWDGETGHVLLTKSQNEFDDPVYSFNYPAYWAYDGMGPAYKNQGLYLSNFISNTDGVISNYGTSVLAPGDELIQVVNDNNLQIKKFWIIKAVDNSLRTVDEDGVVTAIDNKLVKVLRSGRRNLSATSMGTIVSLKNPVVANTLKIDVLTEVLNANAAVFNEEWDMPVKLKCSSGCPPGYSLSSDGFCYLNFQNSATCHEYMLGTSQNIVYSQYGSRIFNPGYSQAGSGSVLTDFPGMANTTNTFWKSQNNMEYGPMNRCAIWGTDAPSNTWIGVSRKIDFPDSKTYYFGLGGDNFTKLKIDGEVILEFKMNPGGTGINGANYDVHFKYWNIYPVYLPAGTHIIEISGSNDSGGAGFGCEIYNNTPNEIMSASSQLQLNLLFTTQSLRIKAYTNIYESTTCKTCPTGYAFNPVDRKCYNMIPVDPNLTVFNPYKAGVLGNWHSQRSYGFDILRTGFAADPSVLQGTDIRRGGSYSNFAPFWIPGSSGFLQNTAHVLFPKWIWNNEVTGFNRKGFEVENKDALDRFSSVQTGYLESLPVAITTNSKQRDMAYDGFEDYNLTLQCQTDTCNLYPGHFNFREVLNSSVTISDSFAHTGNYSLRMASSVTLSRTGHWSAPLYTRDAKQQFQVNFNYPMLGFSPALGGEKYVLSFWVKDNNPASVNPRLNVTINGSIVLSGDTYKASVVEGWKRVEVVFTLPMWVNPIKISFSPTGTTYLDDIRILPVEAQMKSFAYDVNTLKLMAELDENNFATFYEYDDEGTLIRVKKETAKGIMTIRETRSGLRKTGS